MRHWRRLGVQTQRCSREKGRAKSGGQRVGKRVRLTHWAAPASRREREWWEAASWRRRRLSRRWLVKPEGPVVRRGPWTEGVHHRVSWSVVACTRGRGCVRFVKGRRSGPSGRLVLWWVRFRFSKVCRSGLVLWWVVSADCASANVRLTLLFSFHYFQFSSFFSFYQKKKKRV